MKRFLKFFFILHVLLLSYAYAQPAFVSGQFDINGTTNYIQKNLTLRGNVYATDPFLLNRTDASLFVFGNSTSIYWKANGSDFWRGINSRLANFALKDIGGMADMRLNATGSTGLPIANKYYTFIIGTNPSSNNDMSILMTAGNPVTISSVTQSPTNVYTNQSVVVTITLSGTPGSDEFVYLRYTTDAWATSSTVVSTGSGVNYTATIPTSANATKATSVQYYVFTSPSNTAPSSADADYLTLKLNNNGGTNYTYTVRGITTISLNNTPSNSSVSGQPIAIQPQVKASDNLNSAMSNQSIVATINTGFTLVGTTTLNTDVNGLATFTDLSVTKTTGTGNATIAFTTATSITATYIISVSTSPPQSVTINTQPSPTATTTVALSIQPIVLIKDNTNTIMQNQNVSVASSNSAITIGGTITIQTDANGIATFSGLTLTGTGTTTLVFTSGSITIASNSVVVKDISPLLTGDFVGGWSPSVAATEMTKRGNVYTYVKQYVSGLTAFKIINGANGWGGPTGNAAITLNTRNAGKLTYNNGTNDNLTFTASANKYYTVIVPTIASTSSTYDISVLETTLQPVTISSVSLLRNSTDPIVSGGSVTNLQSVKVNATISAAISAEEKLYLKYSANNFTTSTILSMTGSAQTYSTTIPAIASGTIKFYIFSSISSTSPSSADEEYVTLNRNDNSGNYYSYTIITANAPSSLIFSAGANSNPALAIKGKVKSATIQATTTTPTFKISDGGLPILWGQNTTTPLPLNTPQINSVRSSSANNISFQSTVNKYYTINVQNITDGNLSLSILETSSTPITFGIPDMTPTTPQSSETVSVTMTYSGTKNPEEYIYLNYSNDNGVTWSTIQMNVQSQSLTGIIPKISSGTVLYYVFSSTSSTPPTTDNEPYVTLNRMDNNGAYYSYVVKENPTIKIVGDMMGWATESSTSLMNSKGNIYTYTKQYVSSPAGTKFKFFDGTSYWANNTITDMGVKLNAINNNQITGTTGNLYINNPTGNKYYTFIVQAKNPFQSPLTMSILETSTEPVSITNIQGIPTSLTPINTPVTITASFSGTIGDQVIYLKYTYNDTWANASIIEMSVSGSTATGQIPGTNLGITYKFQIVVTNNIVKNTSGKLDTLTKSLTDADYFILSKNDNNGLYYSFAINGVSYSSLAFETPMETSYTIGKTLSSPTIVLISSTGSIVKASGIQISTSSSNSSVTLKGTTSVLTDLNGRATFNGLSLDGVENTKVFLIFRSPLSTLLSKEITLAAAQATSASVSTTELLPNYPNPFNNTTTITYRVNEPARITIDVFDFFGVKLKTIVDNASRNNGTFTEILDGSTMPTGIYIVRIKTNDSVISSRKITLVR